jgi:hypothetical protein
MIELDPKNSDKVKRWRIPDKYLNDDFVDFILKINAIEVNGKYIDEMKIYYTKGSLQEWVTVYKLSDKYGITVEDILRLFDNKGCALIHRQENYITYHQSNLASLREEIQAKLKEDS